MNVDELSTKVINLIEEVENTLINHMKENGVQIYSFIDNIDKPIIILDDKGKTKDTILAVQFDGYHLGAMLESDLTPRRREFLYKAKVFPYGDKTDRELDKLSEDSKDGFDGFCLFMESALYPLDTLLDVVQYIQYIENLKD